MTKRNRYTKEFKEGAVRLVREQKRTQSDGRFDGFAALEKSISESSFFSLKSSYFSGETDSPIVTIIVDGKAKYKVVSDMTGPGNLLKLHDLEMGANDTRRNTCRIA